MPVLDIIQNNRPKIANSTLQMYGISLRKISKLIGSDIESTKDIDSKWKQIKEKLKEMKPSSRKTLLSSLIVMYPNNSTSNVLEDIRHNMSIDKKIVDNNYTKQELTEKQKENLISWDDVLKIYNNYKRVCVPILNDDKELSKKNKKQLQNYIILSLYTQIPPRRSMDYTEMKIRNIDKEKDNYMESKGRNAYFIFNAYKNASRLGSQKVEIPNSLKLLINKWIKKTNSDYLLSNVEGEPITQNYLTKILNQIFERPISTSMLRHIFLTAKYKDVNLEDLNQTAHDIGSSNINTVLSYVQK